MDKKNVDMLFRKAYSCIIDKISPEKIKKIIPIAFPVLQSTWNIKVLIDEPYGLIDRYILRVLKDFGPCDIKRIDELLCLGEDRIRCALVEMEKLGSPISHIGNKFSFVADGDVEHFRVERNHDFSFCINGISGDILPIDFCRKSKLSEISDLTEEFPLYIKLAPVVNGSESKLKFLQPGRDAGKIKEGVPDGFQGVAEKSPKQEYCRYFLSFLVLSESGINVFSAENDVKPLNISSDYLRELPEIASILDKPDLFEIPTPGINIKQNRTFISVEVIDKSLWNCFETDESVNASIFFMRDFIRNGWLWDLSQWKFSHYILEAADNATATALFVCKASFELEHVYSNLNSRKDSENWLKEFFSNYNSKTISCPGLDQILYPLQKSNNSEVRDFARKMLQVEKKINFTNEVCESFHSSTEKQWKYYITDWIKKAQSSIQIISPVIESEAVFKELNNATQRGVYLQIITSLLDRNGKIKDDGDKQFSSLKLPRQKLASLGASVRATSNIPHAKLIIIDKSIVLFTSANLNDNSLGHGVNNAIETCVVLQENIIIDYAEKLFDDLWLGAQYTQVKDGKDTFITQSQGKKIADIPCCFEGKFENLIFSYPGNLILQKKIIQMLEDAKQEVVLMAMSLYDLERTPDLFCTILKLLKKNIQVTALVRTGTEQFNDLAWPDNSTKKLLSAGLCIKEIPHLHAKGIIVDNIQTLLMSANLNPYSLGALETSHIEFGLEAKENASWQKDFKNFVRQLL